MGWEAGPLRGSTVVVGVLALLLSSCASGDTGGGGGEADSGAFDREVRVSVTNALRFDPATIDAKPGERVKFVIANPGTVDHELAIGTATFHSALADSAGAGHGGGHDEVPEGGEIVTVDAGRTETLVYEMPDDEAPTFACYVDRHDRAGMTGTVNYS